MAWLRVQWRAGRNSRILLGACTIDILKVL
jgi:hypothetical protein